MAEAIAVVLEVEGDVWARDADGDMRLLRAGDSVYAGETVVTAQDARVNLDLSNGDTVQLASGQSLLISAEMLAEAEPSSDEQAVTDPGVEEVLALLEGDGDILEQLEDPAAGTTGGSEGGGRTIVEVTRIVEQIDPLAFNFAGPAREPNEPTPGVTGLAEAQAADEPAAPTAPEEPGTPEQTTPSITVNLDDQNGQSVFESLISGTTTNVEPGQTVAIEVTDGESTVTTSAIVQPDGSYQVIEDLSSLSDGELTATATVSDQAGNEATDTDTALLDTEASATITIHTIAGDDVINEEESGETITITGSVGGDAGEGDTVTLTIWGQTFSGTVDGDNNYAIDVPGSLLASGGFIDFRNPDFREGQNPDFGNGDFPLPVPEGGLVQASVSGSDAAGNPYSASTSRPYQVDTFAGAEISIDTIAGDDVINEDESGETITITGSVYGDASEGDTVTLTVGGETFEGTVDGDNNYAIEVPGSQLADNSQLSATVVGTDDAGNPFSADTAREYAVDTEAAATITINTIAGDDIVNAEEADGNISITGSVGGDAAEGDTVTLTVGGQTYTGEVDGINNYAIDVPGTQLAANDQVGASVSGSDDAGNAFSISTSRPYAVDTVAEAGTVTVDDITNDDVINAAESGQTISVTGTATGGDISAGDDVSVTINGTAYGTAVENDGSWSVDVAGSDLAADSAFDVTVDSTDDAGNTVTTTGSSTHGVDLLAGITVSLDDVNAGNAGNAPIGGTTSDVEQGQTVSLAITDGTSTVNATATVGADGSYETNADLSELVDGNLDVTATVTDQAGNSAMATDTAVLDTVAEAGTVTVDDITEDDVINAAESDQTVTVTGTATGGDISVGDNVSMTINGQDYGATVGNDDTWSVEVAGGDLAADSEFDVTVDSTDDAGNTVTTTGSSTHGVDLLAGITVSLDDVNAGNAGNAPIGGTTSDVEQGQTVSLAITDGTSTVNATATVGADGSYETNADLSELVDGNLDVTATVTDQAGNSAMATDTAVLDTVAEAGTVTVDDITEDDVINAAESDQTVTVTGTATGGDISVGDNVSMTINGQDYGATVGNDDTWSVDVAGSDLAADSAFDVTVDSTDDAGNTVTTTGSSTHGVDLLAGITVSLDDVNAENAGNAPIGGTTSDVEQGQTVSLAITDGTSTVNATATVGADGSYTTTADLTGLDDGNLTATATVSDQAGNSATATDTAVLDAVNERPMADPVSTTADIFDASVSVPSGVSTDPLLFKQFSVDGTVDGNAPEPSPTLGGTDAETPLDELTFTLESIPTSGTLFIDIEGDGTYTSALIGDEFSNDSTFYWLDDGSGSNTINVDFSQAPAADSGITLYAYGYDGVQDNTLLNFQGNGVGVSDDTDNNLQEQVPNQLGYRDGKSQTLVMDFDGPAHGAEISVSRLIKNEGEVGKVEAYLDGEQVGAWTFSGVDGATLNGESVDFNIGGSNGGFNLPDGIAFDQLRFTATEYADGYQANGSSNDSSEYFVDSISYQTFSPAEFEYRVNDSDGAESDSVKVEIGVPETNTDVPESFESGAPSITVVTPEAMTVDEAFLEAGTRAGEVPADGEPGATANGQFTLNAPAGLGILSIAAAGLTSGDAGFANGQVTLNAGQLATLGNDPVVIETPEGNTLRLTGLDADSGTVDFRFELNQAVTNVDGEPLDKAPISLELTDANGTTAQATLNVAILDDGVDTTDDPLAITAGGTAEGNVLDNDSGADVDLEVTSVAFAGIEQPVPENGDSITIAGDNGTLTIGRDGAYSYQANAVEPVNIQGSSADIWETQTAGLWGFDASTTIPLEGDGGLDLTALSTGNDNITFNGGEKSGVGVKVKGGANTIDDGESILIQLEDSTDQLTVGINRFNEAQEKFGFWTAYNDDGDVVGSGGFSGLNNNGDRFELAIETTESFSYLQMGLDTGDVNNNSGYVIDELSYTPTHQFEQDSFTYTVVDQDGSTAEGTLSAFMHSDDLTPFIGTEGDDPLVGSDADEAFAGLAGDDTLTGGLGDDVFKWTLTDQGDTNAPANDVITDFGTGNDVLDLRDLLVDETEQTIGDFLSVEQDGGDLVFQVTHDGGSDGATQTIRLEGKQFADFGGAENSSELIQNMLDSGQLKIDT